ncbi:MAG: phosphatidylglycerophosphatase A, partial [Desulfovibrio sp.]|nr:phosphatidylglycerophosphatase A [Desulfovibrio sp.]
LGLAGRLFLLAAVFVAGSLAATRAEDLLGKKDPGEVVIDELVGAWIAILPFAFSWTLMLCAFVLFRFFDILKPWPVKASENWLPAGWGVMVDDVVGGVMAMICLCLLKAAGVFAFSWL